MSAKVMVGPVRTEVEYVEALQRIEELFDVPEGTPEFDEFDILTILVHEYEQRHFPVGFVEPAATLLHYLDRMQVTTRELIPCIGSKSAVSMILNGKRQLTVGMIRNLHEKLGIPLDLLVGQSGSQAQSG